MMSFDVISWWYCLCALAAFNIMAWSAAAATFLRGRPRLAPELDRTRRLQLVLSAAYVLGCAYRSVFPVYDVPRLCLIDTVASSVIVGRSVATVAELCFVAQWALMLNEVSRAAGSAFGRAISKAVVPLITLAEICSWYSVLTTSNLGHVAEESIWGLTVALLVASVASLHPRVPAPRRATLLAWAVAGAIYVAFMFSVDVPMYWTRWMADQAVGRGYLSVAQGIHDVAVRRVVSHRWSDWRSEVAWMSLYFSVAVWLSIALIHAPGPGARLPSRERRRLPSAVLRQTG